MYPFIRPTVYLALFCYRQYSQQPLWSSLKTYCSLYCLFVLLFICALVSFLALIDFFSLSIPRSLLALSFVALASE